MKKVTTTQQYELDDGLMAWTDQVRDSCVPMTFSTEANRKFRGAICSVDNDGLCVSRLSAIDHIASHDRQAVRRTTDDFLLVSIQVRGSGALEQDARTAFVGPFDMVLFDSSRDFVWHFSGEQYTIRFPRRILAQLAPCGRQHTAVAIPATSGIRRIAIEHIASLHRELQAGAEKLQGGGKLSHVTANLIALALADYFNSVPAASSNSKEMHLLQARIFLRDHIRDPELAPDRIAHELRVSSRYLYRLFADVGESIGETICASRVEGCANWLQQRAYLNRSITDIAMAWGFNDASHFSRVFKRHFGMSARDYRAKHCVNDLIGGLSIAQ